MKKLFKRSGIVLFAAIVYISVFPGVDSYALSENAINSASSWAKKEILAAEELNLITDKVQDDFQDKITREEFSELAVKLYEALSGKNAEAPAYHPFVDTQNPEIEAANKLGIVNGVGNNKFLPHGIASREEVSVMLYNAIKAAKPEYGYISRNEHVFRDQNMISSWAKEAVKYLYSRGVVKGVGNKTFSPRAATSREEAVIMVKRIYEAFKYSEPEELQSQIFEPDDNISSRGGARSSVIETLKQLISQEMGKPYQWGAAGPNSYDCSGLVYYIYGKLGISLPRVSAAQATAGTYVSKSDLSYGDLVFFAADGKSVNHVGIYVGNGEFVHAPTSGKVVKVSNLKTGYYANTYYTARRVIQ
ncbi:MAG TPA: NlpC/P60 family protein [Clostridia bacterium]